MYIQLLINVLVGSIYTARGCAALRDKYKTRRMRFERIIYLEIHYMYTIIA